MGYIFNRINLAVVIIMVLLIVMSINEAAQYAKKLDLSNKAAYAQWFRSQQTVFKTQEECQTATGYVCSFESCDYIPQGSSVAEICGEQAIKGWRQTNVSIPEIYRSIRSLQLVSVANGTTSRLTIDTAQLTANYESSAGSARTTESKKVQSHDITLLINNFITYDFVQLAGMMPVQSQPSQGSYYQLSLVGNTMTDDATSKIYTITCATDTCPRSVIDLKNDLLRLWGGATIEAF